jgi:hypothetical protein
MFEYCLFTVLPFWFCSQSINNRTNRLNAIHTEPEGCLDIQIISEQQSQAYAYLTWKEEFGCR